MTDYIEQAMQEATEALNQSDLLLRIKEALKELRAAEYEKIELEQRLAELKQRIRVLSDETLVQLFSQAQMTTFGLEAEGNYPAVQAKRVPFYSAKIPEDKEAEAFGWLEQNGHADIIKSTVTVALGMKERKTAQKIEQLLVQMDVPFSSKLAVHPSTLKAFVKSEVEAGRSLPLEALGAFVGETIKVAPAK